MVHGHHSIIISEQIILNFSFLFRTDRVIVPMENIIAVQSELNDTSSITRMTPADQVVNDTNVDNNADKHHSTVKQFTIVYAKRMENSSNPNEWRHFSQTFQNSDSKICERWIRMLQKRINGKSFLLEKKNTFIDLSLFFLQSVEYKSIK